MILKKKNKDKSQEEQTEIIPNFENMDSFGYTMLQKPIEGLNMIYPYPNLDDYDIIEEQEQEPIVRRARTRTHRRRARTRTHRRRARTRTHRRRARTRTHRRRARTRTHRRRARTRTHRRRARTRTIEEEKKDTDANISIGESNTSPSEVDDEDSDIEEALELLQPSRDDSEVTFSKEGMLGGTHNSDQSSIQDKRFKLQPRELVGKAGLDRIMSYRTGGASQSRSDFEYKDTKFGRIFSPENIGKYSAKIKQICNSIMNSTGVILIYSQYIDGGLVPIALALEELGFTRSSPLKSLFKTPPTNRIDSIELKQKDDMDNKLMFRPAQYAMITGERSLSPNNVVEIKKLTNVDNKDGSKIKVVLISQAGSEGLDFKFIRQVHILDPWYNMNRIEQIIGRAVRTCSHKDLPFQKRNVEIYLYGTLLQKTKIEAADLYVYRHAEQKSVNIGRVSRLLKSCAIDCLLNSGQIGFTVENMNQTIDQELSSKQVIQYQVGDRPYSSICDYMEKCQYKCTPDAKIEDRDIKDYTYSESFIMMTTEKILQRIRMLFKDRFVYSKKDLIMHINAVKDYPSTQINAALTQIVDDKSEYITDKYGRLGNIVNIGQLYMFQPIELKQKNISTFERRIPISYKRKTLLIKNLEYDKQQEVGEQKIDVEDIGNLIIDIIDNYKLGQQDNVLLKSETNWYKIYGVEFSILEKTGLDRDLLLKVIVYHIIESLILKDMLLLLDYISNKELYHSRIPGELLKFINMYFEEKILKQDIGGKLIEGIIVPNNTSSLLPWNLLIKESEKEGIRDIVWRNATRSDILNLKGIISNQVNDFEQNIGKYAAKFVGFMTQFKRDKKMVFKVKNFTIKSSKGARCDQAPRDPSLIQLNDILKEGGFNSKYIDLFNSKKKFQICVLQELYLRYFEFTNKNKKTWFLSPVQAIILKL